MYPHPSISVFGHPSVQEPFTTMFVNLQGGRFDCPDRIFFDLRSTWEGCNKDRADVKVRPLSTALASPYLIPI